MLLPIKNFFETDKYFPEQALSGLLTELDKINSGGGRGRGTFITHYVTGLVSTTDNFHEAGARFVINGRKRK